MARPSGAVERWRGFPSPDVLLRMLLLHVAKGYSLRETVVRAMLANWTDISDVALLKRLRNWRGVAMLVVHRIASGKRCVPTRRSYQLHDPDCGSDTDSSEHAGCQNPTSMPNRGPSSSLTSEFPVSVIHPQSLAKLLISRLALRRIVTDLARLPIRVLAGCQRSIRNYLERSEFLFWTASRRCWIAQRTFERPLSRSGRALPNH
jgi:hypothetical protein